MVAPADGTCDCALFPDIDPGFAPAAEQDVCPDCDGSGYVEVDAADHRGEHYTRTVKCRTCRDGVDGFDEGDARDPEPDLDAEVAW